MGRARFPGAVASGVVEVRSDLDGLDRGGFWAVVVTFEGAVTCVRFADVARFPTPAAARRRGCARAPSGPGWTRPGTAPWTSRPTAQAWCDIRRRIAAGEVYQVNLCRVLRHRLPETADLHGLYDVLAEGNPAPYACLVDVPEAGLEVVSASPELFLRRSGDLVRVAPDQGHGRGPRRPCCPRTTPRTS